MIAYIAVTTLLLDPATQVTATISTILAAAAAIWRVSTAAATIKELEGRIVELEENDISSRLAKIETDISWIRTALVISARQHGGGSN